MDDELAEGVGVVVRTGGVQKQGRPADHLETDQARAIHTPPRAIREQGQQAGSQNVGHRETAEEEHAGGQGSTTERGPDRRTVEGDKYDGGHHPGDRAAEASHVPIDPPRVGPEEMQIITRRRFSDALPSRSFPLGLSRVRS